jgi:hypothetical protein
MSPVLAYFSLKLKILLRMFCLVFTRSDEYITLYAMMHYVYYNVTFYDPRYYVYL